MQISHAVLMMTLVGASGAVFGQGAPGAPPPPSPGGTPLPSPGGPPPPVGLSAPVTTASSLMRPSLLAAQDTLTGLKLDKWKKGSVRDEAGEHAESLLKDLQTNLPPLLTAADAAPGRLSQAIPLVKHLDAFYDVMLRVEEAARVSAPADQVAALQQSLLQLNQARLALDDHLQSDAQDQEKQMGDLQVALKTARADAQTKTAAAAAPVPCKPVTPAKKKPAAKKATPAPAPSTNTPAKGPPATPAKPKTP